MTETEEALSRAVDLLRREAGLEPALGLVLGSGLGGLVDAVEVAASRPYSEIPGFSKSTVEGHSGRLVIGRMAGVPVAVMQGRVHLYEGYPPAQVVFPTRVLVALGASRLLITNAAGAVNPEYAPKDLMLIEDHLNLTGQNPLCGPNVASLGPRFPDMSAPYDPSFRLLAHQAAARLGLSLQEGVYAGLLGPSYETPAEVRMLGRLGADAVGMSTVHEVIAARHMGARVLGLSCITNMGSGLGDKPLNHAEVKEVADAVRDSLSALITELVPRIAEAD